MAITTYPLNDIEYTAEDAELYNCTRNSGVYSGSDFTCTVNGTNNNVVIGEGVGWIRNGRFAGKVFANREAETIALDVADAVYPRIDVVGVRYETATNRTDIFVKKGAASANPVMPDIVQTETVYELYFYSVYREAAATVITADNVTDLKLDANYCGLMGDAITSIDTSAINEQFSALLAKIKKELADLKIGKIDAYSREETLSPTTKTLLGLSKDAVPDDAFKAVAMPFKVGDILHTMRTDLDDKWLLCNGDVVSKADFPAFDGLLPEALMEKLAFDGVTIQDIEYANGVWVAVGYTSTNQYIKVYTTTDPHGEWTEKQLDTLRANTLRIKYVNGWWLIVFHELSTSMPYIARTTDPTGAWTANKIYNHGTLKYYINDVDYYEGVWVASGNYTNGANQGAVVFISRKTPDEWYDNNNGYWVINNMGNSGSNTYNARRIICIDGAWVAVGAQAGQPAVYTVTDPTNSWTAVTLEARTAAIQNLLCADGVWAALTTDGYIYTTTDPTGAWTKNEISSNAKTWDMQYADGEWRIMSQNGATLWTATDPTGTWTETTRKTIGTSPTCFAYGDGLWVYGLHVTSAVGSNIAFDGGIKLPTITIDDTYTYIKAKE